MTKRPPHIVVTTPESLYILLTSDGGRRMLETARTLILDEIHAVVSDKRGSHLALSIERLEQLVRQHKALLDRSHRSLSNTASDRRSCPISGRHRKHRRQQRSRLHHCRQRPRAQSRYRDRIDRLAVSSGDVRRSLEEVYDRLAQLIRQHHTTLVFVNTRRLAERVSRHLGERSATKISPHITAVWLANNGSPPNNG